MAKSGYASEQGSYQDRLAQLDATNADDHFNLAIWCKSQDLMTEYRELLAQTIAIDPDHAAARRLLRYRQVDGAWYKGAELQRKLGNVLHEGRWISAEEKAKLDQGLRQFRGKWLTEAEYYKARGYVEHRGKWIRKSRLRQLESRRERLQELTRQRSDWSQAWKLKTRYFELTTNTSPQIAVEIADAIDACYDTLKSVYNSKGTRRKIPVEVYANFQQFAEHSAKNGIRIANPGILGYFGIEVRHQVSGRIIAAV